MELKQSETLQNLMRTFSGETQAWARYTFAADSVKAELQALAGEEVPVLLWPDKSDLGLIVGKSRRGALALTDEGFARAIAKVLETS